MDCLRILVIGSGTRVSSALEEAGHAVLLIPDTTEAAEALMVQRFDTVLALPDVDVSTLAPFSAKLKDMDKNAGTHTPFLAVIPYLGVASAEAESAIFDGTVQESLDPDALTLAIARLASAVAVDKGFAQAQPLHPELPVLEVEPLKEQVAYDNELLIELIDLYFSERARQTIEMAEALAAGDYEGLSRIAHTIKGSLGSLHATSSRMTAQALELAARENDGPSCRDFLPVFEQQLDLLEVELRRLRDELSAS